MDKKTNLFERMLGKFRFGMKTKLIMIFVVAKVLPLIILTVISWYQITILGEALKDIAFTDATKALNDSATENIERLSTDTAYKVAEFLYGRDDDILYLSKMEPTEENYRNFIENKKKRLVMEESNWVLSEDEKSWIAAEQRIIQEDEAERSTNPENNDKDGFNYRSADNFEYENVPIYDEITFVDLKGNEIIKIQPEGTQKVNYPLSTEKKNVSIKENTYVKAETYFEELVNLEPGEIYVSDVIGAYVGSNYIGMYTPENVFEAAIARGYDIEFEPEEQAFSGRENPNGQKFEGIVRWGTPVEDDNGEIIGYVTLALNHDHITEFVEHITPMNERYTDMPSAYEGNYAFIWDYKCRNICHPRHHSIFGYDPETGEPEVPWLESSIYEGWQLSGIDKWTDYVENIPEFDNQSRKKIPAFELTKEGLVGLDGRYLNNAPQCTGWMDLTKDGGSGSFYILWSDLHKLTTAAAIPYYTGMYAPSEENDYTKRGFGFVTIGAGLDDFNAPALAMEEKLSVAIGSTLFKTSSTLVIVSAVLIVFVVIIAIQLASYITRSITYLIEGISRFRAGERQFRFESDVTDEFGTLADSFDEMADAVEDSMKNPLCITDMNREIIYMNEYALDLAGLPLEKVVGTPYGENSVYPANSIYCPITALINGTEAETLQVEENRYIRGQANYFLSKTGEKIGYIIETFDVSEMVKDQLEVEEQRTLLNMIFTASPDLIWYKNEQDKYMAVNPRYASLAGKHSEDLIGKTPQEIFSVDVANEFLANDLEAIASATPVYKEETVLFADGHEEILESVRMPMYDGNGNRVGILGYARNVTSRVVIENELRMTQIDLEQAVNNANRANEHKGEFLARMSHEIRTPMNAIIGITNIVQKKLEELSEVHLELKEIDDNISQIEASSQHLLGLLNDILDVSKIEAGKIELLEEIMEINKLANTVSGIIKPRCDEKSINFVTKFDEFKPSVFIGDPLRLRQVLINLLGNAVKFTPEGGTIEFIINNKGRKNGKTLMEFIVSDTGIGIPGDNQSGIFQPFEQASADVSKKFGGTGLGLSISSNIVHLFGGDIQLDSRVGEGSRFSFSIWLKETEDEMQDVAVVSDAEDKFKGKRMLLVDDVPINRMIVASMLEYTGIEIDEASDGNEAVKIFEMADENKYDIILMDVQMPIMDGYEATDIIRMLDREDAKKIPIIAVTANAFKEDIDRAASHGMNAHLAKPVEIDYLLDIMFRFLNN